MPPRARRARRPRPPRPSRAPAASARGVSTQGSAPHQHAEVARAEPRLELEQTDEPDERDGDRASGDRTRGAWAATGREREHQPARRSTRASTTAARRDRARVGRRMRPSAGRAADGREPIARLVVERIESERAMPGDGAACAVSRALPCRGGEVRPRIDGARLLRRHAEEAPRRERELPALVRRHAVAEQARTLSSTACAVATTVEQQRRARSRRARRRGSAGSPRDRPCRRSPPPRAPRDRPASRRRRTPRRRGAPSIASASSGDVVAHAGAAKHAAERLAIAPHRRYALAQRLDEQPPQLARGRRTDAFRRARAARRIGLEPAAAMRRRRENRRSVAGIGASANSAQYHGRVETGSRRSSRMSDADRQVRPRRRVARRERAGARRRLGSATSR